MLPEKNVSSAGHAPMIAGWSPRGQVRIYSYMGHLHMSGSRIKNLSTSSSYE